MDVDSLLETSRENQFDLTQNDGECSRCGGNIVQVEEVFRADIAEDRDFDYVKIPEFVYSCAKPDCERYLTDEEQRQVAETKHKGHSESDS